MVEEWCDSQPMGGHLPPGNGQFLTIFRKGKVYEQLLKKNVAHQFPRRLPTTFPRKQIAQDSQRDNLIWESFYRFWLSLHLQKKVDLPHMITSAAYRQIVSIAKCSWRNCIASSTWPGCFLLPLRNRNRMTARVKKATDGTWTLHLDLGYIHLLLFWHWEEDNLATLVQESGGDVAWQKRQVSYLRLGDLGADFVTSGGSYDGAWCRSISVLYMTIFLLYLWSSMAKHFPQVCVYLQFLHWDLFIEYKELWWSLMDYYGQSDTAQLRSTN